MKISFIAEGDAANVLTEYSYCLNKHSDIESKTICLFKHPFDYTIQHDHDISKCNQLELGHIKDFLLQSDIIIFAEETCMNNGEYSTIHKFNSIFNINLYNKKLCIWHPGSNYRNNVEYYNTHQLRNKISKHLYALDLYYLSPKNDNDIPLHTYQYYEFDYDVFITNFKQKLNKTPRTILHIPSNSDVKGTSIINQCIEDSNLNSNHCVYTTINNIPNKDVLLKKENSIFYVDQVNPMGGYGVALIEALFRSNLTFCTTHNITDAIIKLTGTNEIPIVSLPEDSQEITKIFEHFFKMSNEDLLEIMLAIGQWIDTQYNPKNIVKHFKYIIND